MSPIADTGLLVGFLDASDQHHEWACKRMASLASPLVTCEAVIAETECLVPTSGPHLMAMIQRGALHIVPLLPEHTAEIQSLMIRYSQMKFADACIVRLSEILPECLVFTTDKLDFTIYHRNPNKPIPSDTP